MTSTILTLWYALLLCSVSDGTIRTVPRVEYAEADGWHYIIRHRNSYLVLQSGSPNRFQPGDRLKNLRNREGEQWILINDTPNRTSVLVQHASLDYDQARMLSAGLTLRQLAGVR